MGGAFGGGAGGVAISTNGGQSVEGFGKNNFGIAGAFGGGAGGVATDGGKTFTKVFQKDNACMYFNDISCANENVCIAAAEGHNCATPGAHFYMTHDGGKTWNSTGSDAGGGAMGCKMVNEKEGWI